MKYRMIASMVALGFGLIAATAVACPNERKTTDKADPTAKTVADQKVPCAFAARTVSAKAGDVRSESSATTKSSGCSKPCPLSGAKTVAGKSKGCAKGCGKGCGKKDGCPVAKKVEAILTSLPSMKYRVGDEVTECSKSAAAMAKKSGKTVEFVVGDEVLTDEGEAMAKLTALLEKEAEALRTMQYVAGGKCSRCPVTAKSVAKKTGTSVMYRVGGVDFEKREAAEKALASISEALAELTMAYKVDGKIYHCDKAAGAKCKEAGKKMIYVVNGEETPCKTTAKLKLTESKVRKIVEAAVATSFSL